MFVFLPWESFGLGSQATEIADLQITWGEWSWFFGRTTWRIEEMFCASVLPSGKRLHSYGKSPCYQWENPLFLSISMVIFNSYVTNYQAGYFAILWNYEHNPYRPQCHRKQTEACRCSQEYDIQKCNWLRGCPAKMRVFFLAYLFRAF